MCCHRRKRLTTGATSGSQPSPAQVSQCWPPRVSRAEAPALPLPTVGPQQPGLLIPSLMLSSSNHPLPSWPWTSGLRPPHISRALAHCYGPPPSKATQPSRGQPSRTPILGPSSCSLSMWLSPLCLLHASGSKPSPALTISPVGSLRPHPSSLYESRSSSPEIPASAAHALASPPQSQGPACPLRSQNPVPPALMLSFSSVTTAPSCHTPYSWWHSSVPQCCLFPVFFLFPHNFLHHWQ